VNTLYSVIIIVILALIVSMIMVVGIAWTHYPRGIIHYFLMKRKGDSNGKNR